MIKNRLQSLRIFKLTSFTGVACLLFTQFSTLSITSCGTPAASDSTQQIVISGNSGSREDLLKIIEGGWVNVDYIDALQRVHSPMFAAEAGRPVQELAFDITNVNGDTLINTSGRLNLIEGERFDVVFVKESDKYRMKIVDGRDDTQAKPIWVGYQVTGGDTLISLIHTATNDTIWYRNEFRTFPKRGEVHVSPLEHCVNTELFDGEWKAADGQEVKFNANGTVSGWADWTMFSVEVDRFGIEIQPDVISAYNDKKGATYVYTLDNGRLSVYEYMSEGDNAWTRGKLVAEFTRK